jgi:hypothetical protein
MEPMGMKIHRASQSSQNCHNNIYQWNSWNEKQLPSNYGQQSQGKILSFNNRKTLNSERNLIKSERSTTQHCGFQNGKQIDTVVHNGQTNEAVRIEWDCIDSFHEFAIYLEKSNPICPAEHLDTPEKLMNLLVF